ncbi:MAG: GxGYxYP domain-containing protein, partial [Verrucomicrobiota bacterium]
MKPHTLRRTFAFVFIVVQVLAAHDGLLAQSPIFPKGTNLTSLTVIHGTNLGNDSQKFLMATLQGLVARRSSSQIYIDNDGSYGRWKNHLRDNYGVPYTTTPILGYWTMVGNFAPLVSGRYILYNRTANANSISVANSLSGPLDAVAVDASIELSAKVLGGLNNKILDVSARDEAWAWTNYYSSFNRSNVVEQEEWIAFNLRDYAAMANAFTFFDGNSTFRSNVLSAMDPDTACIGWGDGSLGEDQFVSRSSSNGVFTVPANFALNLSTLSSVRDPFLVQRTYTFPTPETNVHYVTFIATDGDNVQWDVGGYDGYFSQPQRGSFNMGWTIAPTLPDLAPSVMRWFYENSSNGPSRDFFVCGASGAGYMYPSMYPSAELPLHVQKLNNLMARADLNISEILDFNSVSRIDLWNQYLAQPAIDALYYLDYSPYHGAKGAVYFSTNGKPVIACRESLWA